MYNNNTPTLINYYITSRDWGCTELKAAIHAPHRQQKSYEAPSSPYVVSLAK